MGFIKRLRSNLSKGRGVYLSITPHPLTALKLPWVKVAITAQYAGLAMINLITKKASLADTTANILTTPFLSKMRSPLKLALKRGILATQLNNNNHSLLLGDYEKNSDGRIIRDIRIMYHDANKAKKHLDVHIGRTSLIYRVSGKPVEAFLKFNNRGELTQESKDRLLEHVRSEIKNNSRVPQNLDHTITNARCQWLVGRPGISGYGSGLTRQLVAEGKVEFYHHKVRSSEHMYCPLLNPDQGLYIYQIYPGTETGTPILIWGNLIPLDEAFKDRLHLTLVQPENLNAFKVKIDQSTNTRKYDGASCYFTSNGQGFKVFSPRFSSVTGHRIEYTYKLPEIAENGSKYSPQGMAELMFWKRTPIGMVSNTPSGTRGIEGISWKYLSSAEIGGVLNSNQIRPRDIYPELRVYRMDRFEKTNTFNLPFHSNRHLQTRMIEDLDQKFWKTVDFDRFKRISGREGFVGVPKEASVNDGLKLKWWGDASDWKVTSNNLSLSEKGNIQGVLEFKSLESGKSFNLGPGQIGSFDECMSLMEQGNKVVGSVAKVHGRDGHEGRAAKLVEWHLDKS